MIVRDLNDNIIKKPNRIPFKEKCVFCGIRYISSIDKHIDICPNCEESALEF